MRFKKSYLFAFLLVFAMSAILVGCGNDEAGYPEQSIELIVAAGPGGGSDIFARAVADELEDSLGVSIIPVNIPGSAQSEARQEILDRPADGYTFIDLNSPFAVFAAEGLVDERESFDPLAILVEDTYALHVQSGSELADFNTFLAEAEERPGEITVGVTSAGGYDGITMRQFEHAAGVDLNIIPYDFDAGQMTSDLLSGDVDVIINEVGPMISLIESGDTEMMVFFSEERIDEFPDITTALENDVDMTEGRKRGFMIHADTPQEIKDTLEEALLNVYETDGFQQFLEENHLHYRGDNRLNAAESAEWLEDAISNYEEILAEMD